MSKLLILALFCSILYYSNAFGKIRSNKIQTEATYCQKPRKISPFDSVRASSQIGTGADFLFRNNLIGKSVIINLFLLFL